MPAPAAAVGPAAPRLSLLAPFRLLVTQWHLIAQLTRREIASRYRGSRFGMLWSILNPLLLLGVYTFVFSTVFRMRWGPQGDGTAAFAMMVFAGLVVHGLFAECANRAPGLVVAHANYVKKVVFPLEVLPWVTVLAALFHTGISLLVLVIFIVVSGRAVPITVLTVPLIFLPLVLFTVGATWFLSAVGVYLRDIGQTIGLVTTLLLFMSPVFYPLEAVPPQYRSIIQWNFLTPIISDLRAAALAGNMPDWPRWLGMMLAGALVAAAGLYWFRRSRRGFSDVL
ncbi:MAG: ABC transporter permease [Casimicrobiaceae bacterium]